MKFLTFVFIFFLSQASISANEREDLLKGVILERISQFITYENDGKDFSICIYKNKEMTTVFDDLFDKRKYKGSSIEIKNISSMQDIKTCNIFYSENLTKKLKKQLLSRNNDYILLVTDKVELLNDGFMLALYLEDSKVRFAINQKALLDAHLKINYRLLKVATKVINPIKNH